MMKFNKMTKKLFTTIAIAITLFSTGASITQTQTTYARARVYRRYHRRAARKISLGSKMMIKSDNSLYENNSKPINYNTATVKDSLKTCSRLPTNHPKVYVKGSHYFKSLVLKALKKWRPEIQASLTNNANEAQVTVEYQNKSSWALGTTTEYYGNTPAKIVFYQKVIKAWHADSLGLEGIITHELGHAWGLAHDKNTYSIMSQSMGFIPNRHEAKKYNKIPYITWQNRRMLRMIYHEGKYAQTNN